MLRYIAGTMVVMLAFSLGHILGCNGSGSSSGSQGSTTVTGNGGSGGTGGSGSSTGTNTSNGTTSTSGITLYVSTTTGDDSASGTSDSDALRTLGRAFELAQPGDTVEVEPGVYHEGLELHHLGDASAPFTIKGSGGRPILDGESTRPLGLFFDSCRNIVIERFEFRNYTDIGVGGTFLEDFTLRDLVVHDNGAAVQLTSWELEGYGVHIDESSNVLVEGCEVFRNGPNPPVFPDRLLGTGINFYRVTQTIARNNECYQNHGGGILVEDSVDVLVEGNDIHHNDLDATVDQWWDGGIWIDGGRDVTVRNNHLHDNAGPGIQISDEERAGPTGYVLEGNISTGNYFGVYLWNFGTTTWPDASIVQRSGNSWDGNDQQDVWIQDWN